MTETIKETIAEPILVEYFNDHYYKVVVDGVTHFIPSVTTKLNIIHKEGLDKWRGDIGNREADLRMYDASNKGKRIHWAWETALKGGCVVYDPWQAPIYTEQGIIDLKAEHGDKVAVLRTQEEMWAIDKLRRQFETLRPKVIGVEEKVWDLEHRDAGTIDNVLWIEEGDYMVAGAKPLHLETGLYVNDLKTGKFLDDNVWLQLAPYAFMYEQIHGAQVRGALVTHTQATTKKGIPGLTTMFRDRETLFVKDYQDYRAAAQLWERDHADDQPQTFQFPAFIKLNIGGSDAQFQ